MSLGKGAHLLYSSERGRYSIYGKGGPGPRRVEAGQFRKVLNFCCEQGRNFMEVFLEFQVTGDSQNCGLSHEMAPCVGRPGPL